jgi:hypothetical protein
MNEKLERFANMASDRYLDFSIAFVFEWGWLAGFKQGDQWVSVVSDWGATAFEAIQSFEEKLSEH